MILCGDRRLPAQELSSRAAQAASAFCATGARAGGAIGLLLRNDVAFLEALFGAHFVGAYAVPINWHLTADEIGYILRDAGATHLVLHADLLPAVEGSIPEGVVPVCVTVPAEVRDAYGIPAGRAAVPPGQLD